MVANTTTIQQFEEAPARVSEWRRFSRVFFQRKLVIFGLVIITRLIICAIFAPFLTHYNP
jgi:ABC-type antimicrobial peptide transport system permease subunit